jgi:hypothetical protein
MDYHWSKGLYDKDGDNYDDSLLVFIGDKTIIKFSDSVELEQFAHRILTSLSEIRGEV